MAEPLLIPADAAQRLLAAANGDATCLDLFHEPRMHAFGGMCTVIVRMGTTEGMARLSVRGKGLKGSISW